MKRDNPEQRLQISVAQYLAHALKPPTIWTAFPAGGGGKVRGAFLKAMGLKAGWPDVIVVHPHGSALSGNPAHWGALLVGLELKADRGRQSSAQKDAQRDFEGANGFYHVARSVDEVEGFLRGVGIPLSASVRIS